MIDLAKVKTLSARPAKDALNLFEAANQGLPELPRYAAPAMAGPSGLPDTPSRVSVVESSGPMTMTRGTVMRTRKAGSNSGVEVSGRERVQSHVSSELSAAPLA